MFFFFFLLPNFCLRLLALEYIQPLFNYGVREVL